MTLAVRAPIRRWTELLLRINDSPRRTALAYAVGVFIGFSPVLGLQTVLALAVAFLFGLNRPAIVLGAYTNLPWFIGPYYALTTAAAAKVLGVQLPPGFARQFGALVDRSPFGGQFWAELGSFLAPLAWPFAAGSLTGATLLGLLAFLLARPGIEAGRRRLGLPGHPRAVRQVP